MDIYPPYGLLRCARDAALRRVVPRPLANAGDTPHFLTDHASANIRLANTLIPVLYHE